MGAADAVLDGIVEDATGTGNSIVIDDMYVIGGAGFISSERRCIFIHRNRWLATTIRF